MQSLDRERSHPFQHPDHFVITERQAFEDTTDKIGIRHRHRLSGLFTISGNGFCHARRIGKTRIVRIDETDERNSLLCHFHDLRIRILTSCFLPLFPALLQQPHTGNIFQKAGRTFDTAFVCKIILIRFFRYDRFFRFNPHQTPGTATQISKVLILCRNSSHGRSRIMSGNSNNWNFSYTCLFCQRICQFSDKRPRHHNLPYDRRRYTGCLQK